MTEPEVIYDAWDGYTWLAKIGWWLGLAICGEYRAPYGGTVRVEYTIYDSTSTEEDVE